MPFMTQIGNSPMSLSLVRKRAAFAVASLTLSLPAMADSGRTDVRARFADPALPVLVVAHRGCHNPAPAHGFAEPAPENSLAGLERCIAIGADLMETDVRRTKDGYLVLMHDGTVDRMTNGKGKVEELSLAAFRQLSLRQNEGGADAPLTTAHPVTLDEILAAARGRLMLNLDVQAGLYPDVIAAVKRAGMTDAVVIKEPAGMGSPPLAATPPFDTVPFMPILASARDNEDLPRVAEQQAANAHPVGFEMPHMRAAILPPIVALAKAKRIRVWANSLADGFIVDFGGDTTAVHDPDAVWGRDIRSGITAIQTDEPEALLAYLKRP